MWLCLPGDGGNPQDTSGKNPSCRHVDGRCSRTLHNANEDDVQPLNDDLGHAGDGAWRGEPPEAPRVGLSVAVVGTESVGRGEAELPSPGDVGPGGRPPGTPRCAGPGGRPPGTPRCAGPGGRPPGTPRCAGS